MGALAARGAPELAGPAGLHGQEGGQDLRHGRRQGGGGARARARRARRRAQREQLARASRAPQGREDVPPLQERRSTHQVSARRQARPSRLEHDCIVVSREFRLCVR